LVYWRSPAIRWGRLAAAALAGGITGGLLVAPYVARGAWSNLTLALGRLAAQDMISGQAANVWWIFTWVVRLLDRVPDLGLRAALSQEIRVLAISVAEKQTDQDHVTKVAQAVADYLAVKKTDNRSPKTLVKYRTELETFAAFAAGHAARCILPADEIAAALASNSKTPSRKRRALMPTEPPKRLKGVEVAAAFDPAHEVGGDFHDYLAPESNTLVVAVGDVSGKGVPAALYSAFVGELATAVQG
jgi:hypothetical protein